MAKQPTRISVETITHDEASRKKLLDTTSIHALRAVEYALSL